MNRLLLAVLVATILAHLVIWVSSMDYEDQLAEDRNYTYMVCEGHWPDYRNEKPECIE